MSKQYYLLVFHGLVYEVSYDTYNKIGVKGDAKLTVETKCNGVSGFMFLWMY